LEGDQLVAFLQGMDIRQVIASIYGYVRSDRDIAAPHLDRLQAIGKLPPSRAPQRVGRRLRAVMLLADSVRVAMKLPDAGAEITLAMVRMHDYDRSVLQVRMA
jgi:hypothetical protein